MPCWLETRWFFAPACLVFAPACPWLPSLSCFVCLSPSLSPLFLFFFPYLSIPLRAGQYLPQAQNTRLFQRLPATALTEAACTAQRWRNHAPCSWNLLWISLQILSVFRGLWLGHVWVNFQGSSKTAQVFGIDSVCPRRIKRLDSKERIKLFVRVSKDVRERNCCDIN